MDLMPVLEVEILDLIPMGFRKYEYALENHKGFRFLTFTFQDLVTSFQHVLTKSKQKQPRLRWQSFPRLLFSFFGFLKLTKRCVKHLS